MGVLSRVRRIVRANINDLLEKAENPQKILRQTVLEMEESIREAKSGVVVALAHLKRLEKSRQDCQKEVESWQQKAELALSKGDEELAKEALRRKRWHSDLLADYEQQIASQQQAVEALRASLAALSAKLEEAKARKRILLARHQQARAKKKVDEVMVRAVDTSAFEAFERVAERIEDFEFQVAAAAELAGQELAPTISRDKEEAEVQAELSALKSRLGSNPSPKPGATIELEEAETVSSRVTN